MRRLLKILGYGVLIIELLIVGAVALVQTDAGKSALARAAGHFSYDAAEGTGVKVKGVTGSIPWDIGIDTVELYDRQGVYATLERLHLAWEPKALLKRHVHILALEAEDIHLIRLPLPPLHPQAASKKPFTLPHIPNIAVDKLDLKSIRLAANVAGSDQQWSVTGGGSAEQYRLALSTLMGPQTSLNLDVNFLPSSIRAHGILDEAPGGIVLNLLKVPGQDRLHLALDTVTDAQGTVHLEKGELALGKSSLTAQGDYRLEDAVLRADLTASLPDLDQFSMLAGAPLKGAAQLRLTAKGPPAAIAAELDGQLKDFATGSTIIPSGQLKAQTLFNSEKTSGTLGGSVKAQLDDQPVTLAFTTDISADTVNITALDAGYGPYLAHAKGTVGFKSREMDLTIQSHLPPLEALAPQLHLEGNADANAQVKGTFDRFHVKAGLVADSPEGKADLEATGDIDAVKKSVEAELNGNLLRDHFTFLLHAPFTADAQVIDVKSASFKGKGFALAADMHWLVPQASGQGELKLDAPDLAPLGALLGQKLSGSIIADATLDDRQALAVRLIAKDIQANGMRLNKARLQADMENLAKPGKINAELTAGPVSTGAATVDSFSLAAKGDLNAALAVKAAVAGTAQAHPFNAQMEAASSADAGRPGRRVITLSRLNGVYDKSVIALAAPSRLTLADGSYSFSPFTLKIAGGTITAKGKMQPNRVDANLSLSHIQLQSLPAASLPEGLANGTLTLTGKPSAPLAALNAHVTLQPGQHPVNADLKGDWRKDTLHMQANAAMDKAQFAGDLSIRAPFSLTPFVAGLKGASALNGSGSLDAALESFNGLLSASGQRVSGQAAGKFTLAGTLSAPKVDGRLTLSQGQYAMQDTGICLKDISASLSGSGEKVTLDSLKALSADGGLLKANASAGLTGMKALQGHVTFDRYRLFCGGLASGTVQGNLDAGGTLLAATLGGVLTFPSLNIQLPGNAPHKAMIPTIKTERVSVKTGKSVESKREAPGTGNDPLRLAVRVHVPNRMFVRGRGLDAEFAGDLDIKGPATNPIIAGQFETKRGNFELLDKTLKLTSAIIRFEGPVPPSPFLDIQAETTVNATTIDVALSGPAAKPEFTMSSTPALPQDEILAELLFGRELANLGPFQVAQLAQATAELSGYSSGPGVLGKVRSFLGVDTLNVGTDTNNDVNVGAGKYITDKIYVGVTQGAKSDSRAVTTEVEIYPHVSGTTGITQGGQQNLGLQWKYDY